MMVEPPGEPTAKNGLRSTSTLGRIRPLLHKEVQARLLGDIAKDLTNAPLADIQKALAA